MDIRAALLLVGALLSGCAYEAPMDQAPVTVANLPAGATGLPILAADRAQPRLALAEHLLAEYFASDIAAPPTVCLAVSDGREEVALPTEQEVELVARFPRLAPFARCGWSPAGWRDTESEEPALVFSIHSFTCASETECSGWASYTAGKSATPSGLYRMSYAGGHWSFVRDARMLAQ